MNQYNFILPQRNNKSVPLIWETSYRRKKMQAKKSFELKS
jgi:hypothetical protein